MAKPLYRLRVMISAPSDMGAERVLCSSIVADVNAVVEDAYGVTLRLIDWRRDIVPGVGADPQQVVNLQTSDYEIYLGLLGTRFGTPTPRAGSGTEDEFNLAYERFRADPTSVRILFYFRLGLSGTVHDIDPGQLRKVQDFRDRVGNEKGVLFADFVSAEDFMRLARNHLTQLVATQWDGTRWKSVPGLAAVEKREVMPLVESSLEPATGEEDDESDLLDLRVQMEESFAAAMRALSDIAGVGQRNTERHRQRKMEAEQLIALGGRDAKRVQTWANSYAQDFAEYARELRPLTAAFREASDDFFDKINRLVFLQLRTGVSSREEIAKNLATFEQAEEVARAARDVYKGIADSIQSLRPLTREFRRQQRNARTQVDEVNAAIANWIVKSAGLRAAIATAPESST
jgi:hypothetical protein